MKLAKYLLTSICLLTATFASAQQERPHHYHYIYGGYNTMTATNKEEKLHYDGFTLGWQYTLNVMKNVPMYVGIGAGFYTNWHHNPLREQSASIQVPFDDEDLPDFKLLMQYRYRAEEKVSYGGIRVPFNFSYEIAIPNSKVTIIPQLGFHINYNLWAHEHDKGEEGIMDVQLIDDEGNVCDLDDDLRKAIIGMDPLDESFSMLGDTDLGYDTFNKIQVGWQTGMRVNYGKYGVGFSYEQEIMRLCSKRTTSLFRIFFTYTL